MKTKTILENELEKACELLKNDEVVAIPTETVYGLGANALSKKAISKIYEAKGRPSDNPLIVHIASKEELSFLTSEVTENAEKLMKAFWPGALTIVFKKSENVPEEVSRGLETVAIRYPKHKTMQKVIKECGFPIAAPSANVSGRPSTTSFEHVFEDLDGKVSGIIKGEPSNIGLESTVIDATKTPCVLLRPGGVTLEDLKKVLGEVVVDKAITKEISDTKKVSSPGMKYKHYAPKAEVIVICGNAFKSAKYIEDKAKANDGVLAFDEYKFKNKDTKYYGSKKDESEQAKLLFSKLREFDDTSVEKIYAMCPSNEGIGLATSNRLRKASGFNEVNICGRVYGLTGRSGSGKSTVSKILENQGYDIIDCDKIYGELLKTNENLMSELKDTFKSAFEGSELVRSKLAEIVFEDEKELKKLNNITHKYVKEEVEKRILTSKRDIILDAPLLFEAGFDVYCDKTIGIVTNESEIEKRLEKRDFEKNYKKRLKFQKSNSFFTIECDIIIENNSSLQKLEDFILKGEFYEFITK